jgi:NitT/TauT family transport system substrate-binding protein
MAALIAAALLFVGCSPGAPAGESSTSPVADDPTQVVIASPTHNMAYLPLYVGIDEGIFAKHGLKVEELLQTTGGGAHVNAVLQGDAWGFIGGPEHNGYIRVQGGGADEEIKAIAGVCLKGYLYLTARTGVDAPTVDTLAAAAALLKGQSVVMGPFGGTPNALARYVLAAGDVATTDVTLVEAADNAAPLAVVRQSQTDYGFTIEPFLSQGIAEGVWQEPILSVPQAMGEYAFTVINVPTATYTVGRPLRSGRQVSGVGIDHLPPLAQRAAPQLSHQIAKAERAAAVAHEEEAAFLNVDNDNTISAK